MFKHDCPFSSLFYSFWTLCFVLCTSETGWALSWLVSLNVRRFSISRDSANRTLALPLGLASARTASAFVSLCVPSPQSDKLDVVIPSGQILLKCHERISSTRRWPLSQRICTFQLSWLSFQASSSPFLCHLLHHSAAFTVREQIACSDCKYRVCFFFF